MSVRYAPPVPDEPTAKHAVVLGHDTPESADWPAAFGLATTDQLAPAGCSTSVTVRPAAFSYWPTAKHFVAVAQDTPASVALGGVGMTGDPVTFDQLVPFHRNWKPAIKPRMKLDPPATFGLGTIDQLVPSNCSTTVLKIPVGLFACCCELPAAKQAASLRHVTPSRKVRSAPGTFGLATIDQLCPSHASISVVSRLPSALLT